MVEIPIILLAGGASVRMQQPKQLLPWGGKTLIEHQVQVLLKTGQTVFVVVGAYSEQVLPVVGNYPVTAVFNSAWERGMSSSIACGLHAALSRQAESDAVLIALVDQPLVPFSHYQELISTFDAGCRQIIASASPQGWLGVPALFDKHYFAELLELQGEKGAKPLFEKYAENVKALPCQEIDKDLDTLEAYQQLVATHFT